MSDIETLELQPSEYNDRMGYDSNFIKHEIPLPKIPKHNLDDCVKLLEGEGYELKYTHFSIVMSKSRYLAIYTAVNIDGNKLTKIDRSSNKWYFDPRIKKTYQAGPEIYKNNDLDRGHLVRRLDPVWGDEAEQANEDTFHFTNCSPQHNKFNTDPWVSLENYILNNTDKFDLKVNVFTGPVFRIDDMLYRNIQIPAEFWKVVVMVKDDNNLSATAYLQTQKNLIKDIEFAFGKYQTYQVPISHIEKLAELDFGILSKHDPLVDVESNLGTTGKLIQQSSDILL